MSSTLAAWFSYHSVGLGLLVFAGMTLLQAFVVAVISGHAAADRIGLRQPLIIATFATVGLGLAYGEHLRWWMYPVVWLATSFGTGLPLLKLTGQ